MGDFHTGSSAALSWSHSEAGVFGIPLEHVSLYCLPAPAIRGCWTSGVPETLHGTALVLGLFSVPLCSVLGYHMSLGGNLSKEQSLVSSPTTTSLLHAEPWAAELSSLGHCRFLVPEVTFWF